MPRVFTFRFPRYGLPRPGSHLVPLGQLNAAANLVPGQTYTFTYSFQTGPLASTVSEDDVANALEIWSPFSSGTLGFSDISVNQLNSILTLSILANAGSDNLTQGNVGAAIAATLNSAAGWLGTNFTLKGPGTTGLQTPTAQQELAYQYSQTPTPTVVDSIKAIFGAGPALPGTPSAPWYVYAAGLGLLGLVVYSSTH